MAYSSVNEIAPMVRHLLDGSSAFSTTTTPTAEEVTTILRRLSGVLDTALAAAGFSVPIDDPTAKLSCDEWTLRQAVAELRAMYPHMGLGEQETPRRPDVFAEAMAFAKMQAQAFRNLGLAVTTVTSEGLTFTAYDKHSQRSDPDNSTLEQPKFRRGMFDNPGTTESTDEEYDY